jgi:hypothetical protein
MSSRRLYDWLSFVRRPDVKEFHNLNINIFIIIVSFFAARILSLFIIVKDATAFPILSLFIIITFEWLLVKL